MKVLVTGGCGFIGSAVIRHGIRDIGAEILNIDKLTYAATPAALEDLADHPNYRFLRADICDRKAIARAFEEFAPDAVMHLAAESHVDRSIEKPSAFIETNLIGTFTMLEAARDYWSRLTPGKQGAFRFHHVSTDEVFGALTPDDPAFTETTAYAPRSPYSASKAGSDHLVAAWGETYGLPVVISNCSNNYGRWQFPEKLIPTMIINAFEGRPLPVYGEGRNVRDWLFVEDHAQALWLVLGKGQAHATYNIGGNSERRNIDVVRAICAIMDDRRPEGAPHERLISFVTDRPGHDFRYAINADKIASELGWRPSLEFEEGLARTVDWYLANAAWWQAIRENRYDGQRQGLIPDAAGSGTP